MSFTRADVDGCVGSPEYERFCAGQLDDPYPLLAWLRDHDPVHHSPQLDAWIVTRHDDVLAGLLDPRLANDRVAGNMNALPPGLRTTCAPLGDHVSNWLGFTDPPKHTRLRNQLRTTFTPALARRLEARIVAIVDELLTEIETVREPDLIAALAYPLPARVICEVLGVPIERSVEFQSWSDDLVAFTGNIGPTLIEIAPRALSSYVALDSFINAMLEHRHDDAADDVIGGLAAAECAGELSRDELVGLSVFTLVAGHETTVSLLSTGLRTLLEDESLRQTVSSDPAVVPTVVEELLRLEAPIQFSPRLAREDLVLRGRTIPKGSIVMLHIGAANRDPEAFADPDIVRLDRAGARHLSFAWGPHFCLGAPLARAEAAVALPRVLARFPDLEVMPGSATWRESMAIRGLTELRVTRGGQQRTRIPSASAPNRDGAG
jgi:cytochrome P450